MKRKNKIPQKNKPKRNKKTKYYNPDAKYIDGMYNGKLNKRYKKEKREKYYYDYEW